MPNSQESITSRLATLEAKFSSIESSISQALGSIEEVSKKLDARSVTPWSALIGAAGVMVSVMAIIGAMALAPLKETSADISRRVDVLESSVVPLKWHEKVWAQQQDSMQRLERRMDKLEYDMPHKRSDLLGPDLLGPPGSPL